MGKSLGGSCYLLGVPTVPFGRLPCIKDCYNNLTLWCVLVFDDAIRHVRDGVQISESCIFCA